MRSGFARKSEGELVILGLGRKEGDQQHDLGETKAATGGSQLHAGLALPPA
jgi:hypothetical protein